MIAVEHIAGAVDAETGEQLCTRCRVVMSEPGLMPWPNGSVYVTAPLGLAIPLTTTATARLSTIWAMDPPLKGDVLPCEQA